MNTHFNIDALKQLPKLGIAQQGFHPNSYDKKNIDAYLAFYDIHLLPECTGLTHDIGFIQSRGYNLFCHKVVHPEAKGTFFLLHGYYDHVGLFSHILRFMISSGFNVFAFDLPGHGLSSGARASINDFSIYTHILDDLLIRMDEQLKKPWHGFGQSTGCAILTDCLIERAANDHPSPFEKVVLSAPLVRPWLWTIGRLKLHTARFFIKKLPRHFTDNSRNTQFLHLARNDPLAPDVLPVEWVLAMDRWIRKIEASSVKIKSPVSPLILQGTKDRTVDAAHNIPILEKLFTQPEVLYLKNARHHLPNELPETVDEYLEWLAERF